MPLRQLIYQNNGKSEEPFFFEISNLPKLRTKPLTTLGQSREKIRVGILSDFLQEPLIQAINIAASTLNLALEVYPFAIETIENSLLDKSHGIYKEKIDILIVYPDYLKSISLQSLANGEQGWNTEGINKAFEKWANLLLHFRKYSQIPVIIHNAPDLTPVVQVKNLNEFNSLLGSKEFGNYYWIDLGAISKTRQPWFDHRLLEVARFPFALEHLNFYSGQLAATIREILHKPIKIVVTDLDNTLWDGVLGEHDLDSFVKTLNGISLSNKQKNGVATILADLIGEGYLVAIASKNDESKVTALFDQLTDFPLKKEDIYQVYANWGPKSESIGEILKSTGFQEDALLYIDDSIFECLEVKNSYPGIVAINVSEQKNVRRDDFMNMGYFRERLLTREDTLRKSSYLVTSQLEGMSESEARIDFLKSLAMKIRISKTDDTDLVRLQQMDERTNQFRANRVFQMETDNTDRTQIKVQLRDNFTNYGTIAIVDYLISSENLKIYQWLMSCRVFSRGVEEYVLSYLIESATTLGVDLEKIQIDYLPTGKNGFFLNKMNQLGFLECEDGLCLSDFTVLGNLDTYIIDEMR